MKFVLSFGTFVLAVFVLSVQLQGQGVDPGDFDPGDFNQGNNDNGQITNGGTNSDGDFSQVGDFSPEIPEIEDLRNENGFIGRTRERIETQGFVGPTREAIQAVSGSSGAGGGGAGGNFGRGGFGTAFGGAQQGFTITRSSVRARVRPNFSFPSIPTQVVQDNFQRRIQRLPNLRTTTPQRIKVSMDGTTATLTGTASNQEAVDNMVGQLRMEPGIYRIINQVELMGDNQVGQKQ